MDRISVNIQGETIECPSRTTLYELAQKNQDRFSQPILAAYCDGVLQELYHEVYEGEKIEFLTFDCKDGKSIYFRGISMMLLKAVYSLYTKEKVAQVTIHYSIDSGYYFRINGEVESNPETAKEIEEKMQDYVKRNLIFEKKVIATRDAQKMFEELGMDKKALLCRYRRNSRMTLYKLGHFVDYYYGAMPYSTGVLKHFSIQPFEKGFVFILSKNSDPSMMPDFKPSMKLFHTMRQNRDWSETLHVSTVGELNREIVSGNFRELMLTQEALHEKRIGDIAEEIATRSSRVVTIAGPSSSGKTTFSYRLSTQLRTLGLNPHPISLDNYFVNREHTPKGPDGKYNYECMEALDISLLNENLQDLLAGKEVMLPTYNFISGCREYNDPPMKIGGDDILVIEGIHGLNDKLTYSIPPLDKYKIYISALTTLNLDNHNRISTTQARLIRRIIRDSRTRGSSAQKTISMWESVRKGENENIFPYQEKADAMFNSALIYELAAMKLYADPVLFQVPQGCPEYTEAQRLLKFLDYFLPVDPHDVPLNSILREFIGGGILLN